MTSIHHHHALHRSSPPNNVKKTAVRAQRPTPLTRSASTRSVAKGSKAKKQADVVAVDDEVQDDGMATSFLQFCAMCEKQIIVPNNSILYCSESCRRKDCTPPPQNYNPYTSILPPFPPDLTDPLGPKIKELIPRLQPTVLPPASSTRIPTLFPHFKSDLDPTEWKPKLPSPTLPVSEAFQYLSQFHTEVDSLTTTRRPVLQARSRTVTNSTTTTPSLSHTPSSASSRDTSPVGTPYEFVTRPLAPRHDPAAAPPKSVDLVTPLPYAFGVVPTLPAADVDAKLRRSSVLGELSYEKSLAGKAAGAGAGAGAGGGGGLKELLHVEGLGGKGTVG